MFFRSTPTISDDDLQWQIACWHWLLANLGGIDALRGFRTLRPSHQDFPRSGTSGRRHAEHVFKQVATRFGVDADSFSLVEQEEEIDPQLAPLAVVRNAPLGPLGSYSSDESSRHMVTYSQSLLRDLESLVATFAHEICHPILLSIPSGPPGGPEAEEFATDLAMVFFGFGVFGGNAAFQFSQFSDPATGTQGWATRRAGYLSQNEWGFALAVRAHLTGESPEYVDEYCSSGLAINFRKNFKYLIKNRHALDRFGQNETSP